MKNETHKPFKFTAMILALVLLFPFTSEALHLFSHEGHEHCTDNTTTHFHQHNFECEIFDFKFSAVASFLVFEEQPLITNNYKIAENCYQFFYSKLSSNKNFKRGPPAV
jgi:hypothetical protein